MTRREKVCAALAPVLPPAGVWSAGWVVDAPGCRKKGSHGRNNRSIWQDLIARITGPMSFRLVLQPDMAAFLAVKAGLDDGRHGRPAFLWAAFHDPAHRQDLLKEG